MPMIPTHSVYLSTSSSHAVIENTLTRSLPGVRRDDALAVDIYHSPCSSTLINIHSIALTKHVHCKNGFRGPGCRGEAGEWRDENKNWLECWRCNEPTLKWTHAQPTKCAWQGGGGGASFFFRCVNVYFFLHTCSAVTLCFPASCLQLFRTTRRLLHTRGNLNL